MNSASGGLVMIEDASTCAYAITTVETKHIYNWDTNLFEVMPGNNTPLPSHLRIVPLYVGDPISRLRVDKIPQGIPETPDAQLILMCYASEKREFVSYMYASSVLHVYPANFRFEVTKV